MKGQRMRTIFVQKLGKVDKLGDLGYRILDEDMGITGWRSVRVDERGHLIVTTDLLGAVRDIGPGRIVQL